MVIASTTSAVSYVGTGSAGPFPFTWSIAQASDLVVVTQVVATGVVTPLVLTTGFTVTGVGIQTGGNVALVANAGVLPTGTNLFIASDPAQIQALLLQQGANFNASDLMNALDLLTREVQATRRIANNAIQFPITESLAGLNATLPTVALRASKSVAFDSLGNLTAVAPLTGATVSAPMIPVVTAASLALARAAIGVSAAMDPVVTAASLPAARVAMGPWSDALATATGSITARTHGDRAADRINVLDYGADRTGVADCTTAVAAAYAALPAAGGTLYFPRGTYVHASQLLFSTASKSVLLMGDGPGTSTITSSNVGADGILISNSNICGLINIGITSSAARALGLFNFKVSTASRTYIENVFCNGGSGGGISLVSAGFTHCVNVQGDTTAGTCLSVQGTGGTFSNIYMRSGGLTAPAVVVTGVASSMHLSNSQFSGGGPRSTWSIAGISSTAGNFTVTTTANHDFQAGDFLAIRGSSVAAYNNAWRILSKTATTVTVSSTLNPGTATATGTAESLSACLLISNEVGAINESVIDNCLFEAITARLYGSVALYFDGRRGTPGSKATISGWALSNIYYDYGSTGLLISGCDGSGTGIGTVSAITVNGGVFVQQTRSVHLDQAQGCTFNGLSMSPGQAATNDGINIACGMYVYAGLAAPFTQGTTITGCNIGAARSWDSSQNSFSYGLVLDQPGINDLTVSGNNIYGASQAIIDLLGANQTAQRWRFTGNQLNTGSFPLTNTNYLPSIASAASLNINPYYDIQKVTGITNIATISPAHIGQELKLLFVGALSLTTGGNLAIAANYTVLAGQVVSLVYDGSSWYLK